MGAAPGVAARGGRIIGGRGMPGAGVTTGKPTTTGALGRGVAVGGAAGVVLAVVTAAAVEAEYTVEALAVVVAAGAGFSAVGAVGFAVGAALAV